MALEAGVLTLTVEFGQGLKDKDWFGKQDPFCIVTIGSQTFRTRTAHNGGTAPVWNETFKFSVINENNFAIVVKDEDVTEDEIVGHGNGDLSRARQAGTDRLQVPMATRKGKQSGFVSISLKFEPNRAGHAQPYPHGGAPPPYGAYPAPAYPGYPPPGGHPPPAYGYPPPGAPAYGAPPPGPGYPGYPPPGAYGAPPPAPYGAPYGAPPPQQYGPPPGGHPPPYGQYPPPQQYPPQPGYGYPPR